VYYHKHNLTGAAILKARAKIGPYSSSRGGRERTYDHEKIKEFILEGRSDKEVAEKIGCHKSVVQKIRMDMGIRKGKQWHPW
jgi:hypothetical protein